MEIPFGPEKIISACNHSTRSHKNPRLNLKVTEKRISVDELEQYDKAFLTGTACEVQPVASTEETQYPERKIIKLIMNEFNQTVGKSE
ncbi:hypothetical protein AB835_06795 [Candidatus Endobugula sertula]|uniref:Aminotransferase class IV n=1 Tax=Candidatus Endobugula sertula TaxID=62101 RepID=A0A1D2QQI6_9GAMM|nr:hypothetical protein AB835_06795 [Candidatus Endobugula sertula]